MSCTWQHIIFVGVRKGHFLKQAMLMKASIKYDHLNNIKADLQDKKMTPLVIHHKLISRYTELSNRKKGEENCLYPALVYHFNVTVHDSFFVLSHLGLIPESRLYGNQGHHFLIPYHTPRVQFNKSYLHSMY